MKKILLFFLALMLGFGLAGAQNTRVLGVALVNGNCPLSYGVGVQITKGDSTLTKKTDWGEDYSTLIGCMYGYEFMAWEAGTYELTYTYDGYETKTQQITVTAGEETLIAPSVSLQPQANEYTFVGTLNYTTVDDETRTVAGAQVRCYRDYAGTEKLAETLTDETGHWQIKVRSEADGAVYFDAVHPNIEVEQKTAARAYSTTDAISVRINCKEKTPDLLGMETCKLKQAGTIDEPLIEVSWTWPQALLDDYRTAAGEDTYKILRVKIFRDLGAAGWSEIGIMNVADNELPGTSFVDGLNSTYRLAIGKTYQYRFDIEYSYPKNGTVRVEDMSRLTITLANEIPHPDTVTLTLEANNAGWGTLAGAGRYEANDQVAIRAKANRGYLFSAWKNGNETVATTAEHKLVITEDMTLTAVFEERPPIYDSVDLTIDVQEAGWGTVEGAGRYAKGEEVKVKAIPAAGYKFKEWRSGSIILSKKAEYEFILDADQTLVAVFEFKIEYRGMVDCKVRQMDVNANRLTWRWPQELLDEYVTAEGKGVYEISKINVFRYDSTDPTNVMEIGSVRSEANTLPATSFVDTNSNSPLITDKTYTYYMEVIYSKPQQQSVFIRDNEHLTVRMLENPKEPDSLILTLRVNDPAMGTVEGAGKYEEGEYVTVKATPNAGYVFVAWINQEDTVAKTAEYGFVLDADLTLTALFKKEDGGTSNEDREQAQWRVYAENGAMVLHSTAACRYDVYNMAGALVKQVKVNPGEYRMEVTCGLYIIRRISATGYSVKKAVVR